MSYLYKSNKYLLPRPSEGDYFDEQEEKRFSDIIDRVLNELVRYQTPDKKGYGVIQEGIYVTHFVNNNSYIELQPTTSLPAIFAFINSIPIYSNSTITFTGLENNQTYYLYLSLVEDRTIEPEKSSRRFGDIVPIKSTVPSNNSNYLLIAIATTTGSSISVNTNPEGKTVLYSIVDYDKDADGIIDNTKLLDGKSLEYILNRSNHIGKQDWETIDTTTHKVSEEDIVESLNISLRFKELLGSFHIKGNLPTTSNNLTHTIPEQTVCVNGKRIVLSEIQHTYIPNRDTYIEVGEDGIYYFIEYLNGEPPEPEREGRYRWLKVVTTSARASTGKIIVERQPKVGDKIVIGSDEFVAVATQSEVSPGNKKFWIGSGDNVSGWIECATSIAYAINTANILINATTSNNIVNLTFSTEGSNGNIPIELVLNTKGDLVAFGLENGVNACILEVVDLRKFFFPYFKEPVNKKEDLPNSVVDGEVRLVKEENTLYRYSTDKKYGEGRIRFLNTPTHGDRLQIGDIIAIATSGVEDIDKKEFSISSPLTSLKHVLDSSVYPSSNLTSAIFDDILHVYTKVASKSENKEIKLLIGNANDYYLSGIAGAGEDTGWVAIGNQSSGISLSSETILQKRGHIEGTSGVGLYYTSSPFEKDLLFVFRGGIYQEPDIDYNVILPSGIQFIEPTVEDGEDIEYIIYRPAGVVQKDITSYSFVTIHKENELVNSLDVETHHKFHDEINHDSVPISDPGTLYIHKTDYKVLGDHISDNVAHSSVSKLEFWWKILKGGVNNKFRIQGTNIHYFPESNLLFDYNSETVSENDGEFWFQADTTIYPIVKDTSESKLYCPLNLSGIGIDEIYFFGKGKAYKSTQSGLEWVDETTLSSTPILNDSVIYNDKVWLGLDNGEFWRRDGVSNYVKVGNIPGTQIKSISTFGIDLLLGTDGEIYRYNPTEGLQTTPFIDISVEWITAGIEYAGLFFFATQNPNRVYKYDGVNVIQETISLTSYGTEFFVYNGRLYLGTYDGKVYEKENINASWIQIFSSTGSVTNFSSANGILYVGIGKVLYKKEGLNNFEIVHIFDYNLDCILATSAFIFVSYSGDIYRNAPYIGWEKVPTTGIDASIYYGNQVKFILKNPEVLFQIRQTGTFFSRRKQYPNDDIWYYNTYPTGETPFSHSLLIDLDNDDHLQYLTEGRHKLIDHVSGLGLAPGDASYITYNDELDRLPESYPLDTISVEHDLHTHSEVPGIVWSIEDYTNPEKRLRGNVRFEGVSGIGVEFYSGLDVEERVQIYMTGINLPDFVVLKRYKDFYSTDWVSSGGTFYLDFNHNLNNMYIINQVYSGNTLVLVDKVDILDVNTIRLGSTSTFDGKVIVIG